MEYVWNYIYVFIMFSLQTNYNYVITLRIFIIKLMHVLYKYVQYK